MNESLFIGQVILIMLFCFGAFKMGKHALITACSIQAILANFFVLKQIDLFHFSVTCSDAFAIGSILCVNLLREFHGVEEGKKAIRTCFFFLVFFVILSQLHLRFHPNSFDTTQFSYLKLLTPAPRLLFASMIVFYLSQHFDLRAFGLFSKILPRSPFPIRSSLSLLSSQLFDTILFSFLGLWGIVGNILHVICLSFLIKAAIVLVMGPLLTIYRRVGSRV